MTAVAPVTTALVQLVQDALPTWQVLDGNLPVDLEDRAILIAFSPTPGQPAIVEREEVEEGGLDATVTRIAVACSAASWNGDMEFTVKRAEVAGALDIIRDALGSNIDLNGIAFDAWMAPDREWYTPTKSNTDGGPDRASVEVDFAITVRVHEK